MKTLQELRDIVDGKQSAIKKNPKIEAHWNKLRAEYKKLIGYHTYFVGGYRITLRVDESCEIIVKSVTGPSRTISRLIKEDLLYRTDLYGLSTSTTYKSLYNSLEKIFERARNIEEEFDNEGRLSEL
jgi:hypothetical protein